MERTKVLNKRFSNNTSDDSYLASSNRLRLRNGESPSSNYSTPIDHLTSALRRGGSSRTDKGGEEETEKERSWRAGLSGSASVESSANRYPYTKTPTFSSSGFQNPYNRVATTTADGSQRHSIEDAREVCSLSFFLSNGILSNKYGYILERPDI